MEMTAFIPNGQVQARIRGDNGFTAIRYVLALSLIVTHYAVLTRQEPVWPINGDVVVKGFFTITGFLATYSYLRSTNVKEYAWKRFRRIYPPYLVVVLACFLLGWTVSTLSVSDYFSSDQSYRYLLYNAVFLNFMEPSLPGVFTDNAMTAVNGSLWFMKVQVLFYCCIPFICWLMRRFGRWRTLLVLWLLSMAYIMLCRHFFDTTDNPLFEILQHQLMGQLPFFLGGMTMLLLFERLQDKLWWVVACGAAVTVVLLAVSHPWLHLLLEPVAYACLIVGLAYACRPLALLHHVPDFSYSLYLMHFPIIQVLIQAGIIG